MDATVSEGSYSSSMTLRRFNGQLTSRNAQCSSSIAAIDYEAMQQSLQGTFCNQSFLEIDNANERKVMTPPVRKRDYCLVDGCIPEVECQPKSIESMGV